MKKRFILITLFLLSLQLVPAQETFQRLLGDGTGPGTGNVEDVLKTDDGGYIMLESPSATIGIAKLDSNYNYQWHTRYENSLTIYAQKITYSHNKDGFIAIGDIGSPSRDLLVVKFDLNGNLLWYKRFNYGETSESAYDVLTTSNGNIVISGYTSNKIGSSDILVLCLDMDGDFLWDKIFGGIDSDLANRIIETSNGFILSGSTKSYGEGNTDIFLLHINKSGEFDWMKTYGTASYESVSDMIKTKNNEFVVLSSNRILTTDSIGNVLWNKTFMINRSVESFGADKIIQTSNNNLIISGGIEVFEPYGVYPYLMALNDTGKFIWSKSYGNKNGNELGPSAHIETKDGGILMLNDGEFLFDNYHIVIKTDNWGHSGGCYQDVEYCTVSDIVFLTNNHSVDSAISSHNNPSITFTEQIPNKYTEIDVPCDAIETTFAKAYGGFNSENIIKMKPTWDGNYIITGSTRSKSVQGNEDMFIAKIDDYGEIIWDKFISSDDESGITDFIETPNGNISVIARDAWAGSTYNFLSLTSNGDILYSTQISNPGGHSFDANSIISTNDNNLLVCGNARITTVASTDAYLAKLNENGDTIWSNLYDLGGEADYFHVIAEYSDNSGYIALGKSEIGSGYFHTATKIDTAGNLLWSNYIELNLNYSVTNIFDVIPTQNGFVFTAGISLSGDNSAIMVTLNKDGDVIDYKRTEDMRLISSITPNFHEGFYLCGYSYPPGDQNAVVIKLNSKMEIDWSTQYGGIKWETANSGCLTKDNGYYLAGRTADYFGGYDVLLMRLNEEGFASSCQQHDITITFIDEMSNVTLNPLAPTVSKVGQKQDKVFTFGPASFNTMNLDIKHNLEKTDVNCNGGNDGTATLISNGGVIPTTYKWSNNEVGLEITNLSAGYYTVTIADGYDCEIIDSIEVMQPDLLTSIVGGNDASCYEGQDGIAYAIASGGKTPYYYYWSNGKVSDTITNLYAGIYFVNVRDDNDCDAATQSIIIDQPEELELEILVTDAQCGINSGILNAQVTGGTEPYSYLWSNTDTGSESQNLLPGSYSLVVTDNNLCNTMGNADVGVSAIPVPICIVTVDTSSGKNQIVWDKTTDQAIEYYNIYKQSYDGSFDYLASQPYDELSYIVDGTSEPEVRANRYKISVVDTCGNESELSENHKTLHLNVSKNAIGDGFALTWGHYEGFNFNTYIIYRGTAASGLQAIDSIAYDISSFTYTDITALNDQTYYYRVAAVKPNGTCLATKASSGPFSRSLSNIEDNRQQGTNSIKDPVSGIYLQVFPNPMSYISTIILPNTDIYQLNIYDLTGKLVQMENNISGSSYQIERANLENGMYIIELQGNKTYKAKLMVK